MKIGMRKPSLKKSLRARTTGKVKRKIKKSVNPLYGKKGMGLVKIQRSQSKIRFFIKLFLLDKTI